MDLIKYSDILYALSQFGDPSVMLWLAIGTMAGMVFGAVPGVTATAGIAIITPITFTLSFEASMALLMGAYCAGYFAGSIPAILINTPGTPANSATGVDGYPMALSFTSVEYFGLAMLGLVCVAGISGDSLLKGVAAASLGLIISTAGSDPISGVIRFSFDVPELQGGIPAVLIGALLYHGIDPGPFFIRDKGHQFMHILFMLVAANVVMLAFGLAARRILPMIVRIPTHTLVPVVAVLSAAGGYAVNATGFDVGMIFAAGILGYAMYCFGFPVAPILLGLVLGPIVEENLRNGLAVNDGDFTVFVTRPISAFILFCVALLVFFFWYSRKSGAPQAKL